MCSPIRERSETPSIDHIAVDGAVGFAVRDYLSKKAHQIQLEHLKFSTLEISEYKKADARMDHVLGRQLCFILILSIQTDDPSPLDRLHGSL